jgi:CRISPR-associated exonuclease Cas4
MDKEGYLSVTDIVDFIYCPRCFYFNYVLKAGKERTPKMARGSEAHKCIEDKSKRAKIIKWPPKLIKKFEINLKSKKFNFNVKIDCLMFNETFAYPVEFKSSFTKLFYVHKLQLAAQSIAIEEVLGKKVPFGYIKSISNGNVVKVEMPKALKDDVIKTINHMQKILISEALPVPTTDSNKCTDCYYKKFCKRI